MGNRTLDQLRERMAGGTLVRGHKLEMIGWETGTSAGNEFLRIEFTLDGQSSPTYFLTFRESLDVDANLARLGDFIDRNVSKAATRPTVHTRHERARSHGASD